MYIYTIDNPTHICKSTIEKTRLIIISLDTYISYHKLFSFKTLIIEKKQFHIYIYTYKLI